MQLACTRDERDELSGVRTRVRQAARRHPWGLLQTGLPSRRRSVRMSPRWLVKSLSTRASRTAGGLLPPNAGTPSARLAAPIITVACDYGPPHQFRGCGEFSSKVRNRRNRLGVAGPLGRHRVQHLELDSAQAEQVLADLSDRPHILARLGRHDAPPQPAQRGLRPRDLVVQHRNERKRRRVRLRHRLSYSSITMTS